jgi:DNA-binding CsgD family transcriptional regulator
VRARLMTARIRTRTEPVVVEHGPDNEPCLSRTAQAAVAALDLVGVPAVVLEHAGRPIASNRRLDRLIPKVFREHKERLQLVNAAADGLLEDALARLATGQNSECSIPIRASGTLPPMIIHMLGVEGILREPRSDALALVTVAIVTRREAPPIPIIQGLFGMTPAEARIAQAVAQCQTLGAIAAGLGLSRQTLRSQIRVALAKAGCQRNIDLAALLAGVEATFD